jgi:CHAT domain-containing protein
VDQAAQRAGAKRLVLELDSVLRYVPFAALSDGTRDLIDKYAIELRAPAGASEKPRSRSAAAPPLSVRGLGVTRAVAGYPALPAVADELRSVVRGPIAGLEPEAQAHGALPGEGFADAAFTAKRLDDLLDGTRGFSVLHLGTHFDLRPGNALRSFLVLGDGAKLMLDNLRGFDFGGIELFTLSACQTGLGGAVTDDGREIEGLSAIVQRRGAKRVVASLWQVEDASTAQLMGALYRGIGSKGADAPRALQRAQLALRDSAEGRYEHPYYWAGFVLSGAE